MPSFLFYKIITTDSTQTKVIHIELYLIPMYVSNIYLRILFSPGHPFWFVFNFLCDCCHQHEHMSLFLTSYYNISWYPTTKLLLFPILLLHSSTNLRRNVCIPNILSFLCVCWRGSREVEFWAFMYARQELHHQYIFPAPSILSWPHFCQAFIPSLLRCSGQCHQCFSSWHIY